MEKFIITGFKDRSGRAIHVDDFVQHRLGKFGKSGGTTTLKVIAYGKKFHFVGESYDDPRYGGTLITNKLCEFVVVTRCDHFHG